MLEVALGLDQALTQVIDPSLHRDLMRIQRTFHRNHQQWWPQILAGITTGITNAASEGINRAIKTDARCAYGSRNPANQRLRPRCATT